MALSFLLLHRRWSSSEYLKTGALCLGRLLVTDIFSTYHLSSKTTSIIVKGSPSLGLDELPTGTQLAAIFGTASVITVLAMTFW